MLFLRQCLDIVNYVEMLSTDTSYVAKWHTPYWHHYNGARCHTCCPNGTTCPSSICDNVPQWSFSKKHEHYTWLAQQTDFTETSKDRQWFTLCVSLSNIIKSLHPFLLRDKTWKTQTRVSAQKIFDSRSRPRLCTWEHEISMAAYCK